MTQGINYTKAEREREGLRKRKREAGKEERKEGEKERERERERETDRQRETDREEQSVVKRQKKHWFVLPGCCEAGINDRQLTK